MQALASILAATDLSAPARHAVDRGYEIAAATGARYAVVHAVELDALDVLADWIGDSTTRIKSDIAEQAGATLRAQLADSSHARGVHAEPRVVSGPPLQAILDEADARDAGLLVLGARGEDFLRHLVLGSTASRILRRTRRFPVLVVKQPPHEAYRRVLVAVDFSGASATAIHLARQVAPQADIDLLHAFEVPFENKLTWAGVDPDLVSRYRDATRQLAMEKLRGLAEACGLEPRGYLPLVLHGDPSQHIVAQEQERDADLIVVGRQGRTAAEAWLLGSVAKHVLEESQCDVLVAA